MSEAKFTPHYLLENLRDIYFAERTGTFIMRRRESWRRLAFERGMLSLAESSVAEENVGPILRESGVDARVPENAMSVELVRDLAATGQVTPAALEEAGRESVQRILKGAFRWDGGTCLFKDHEVESVAFQPDVLFTFQAFQLGVQEMCNFEPLKEVLLDEDRRIRLNETAFLPLQSLNLGVEQGFILSRVDGTLPIRDVALLAPQGSEDRVVRLLFGFLVLGLVLFEPAMGPGLFSLRGFMEQHRGERKKEKDARARVMAFFNEIREKETRDILHVAPGAGPEDVKATYESLQKQYGRERLSPRLRKELKRELGMIEKRLLDAYLLHQTAVIERYSPSRVTQEQVETTDFEKRKELVKSETQASLDQNQKLAEQYFIKAKDYFNEKDFFNCIQFCKLAIRYNQQEAPFFSLMGDALQHNPDHRWQKMAEESYQKAVDMDPWNADYLVALGRLYTSQGLDQRARKVIERALEILPHHVQAQEALKVLSK
jgi:tetratricopeptide (TPR) repeat protein